MMRARSARRPRRPARPGFSMPELMIAVVILSFGVLGLASTAAVMTRQVSGGATQATAAQVAESRFETMRGQPCASLTAGSAHTRGIDEQWTVTPGANNTVRVSVNVSYLHGGATRSRSYASGITC